MQPLDEASRGHEEIAHDVDREAVEEEEDDKEGGVYDELEEICQSQVSQSATCLI